MDISLCLRLCLLAILPMTQRNNVISSLSFLLIDPKNEQGKPIIELSNIKVSAPKTGKTKSSYFQLLGFTTISYIYFLFIIR